MSAVSCWKYKVSNTLYKNGVLGIYCFGNWELLVRWRDISQATKFEKVVEKYADIEPPGRQKLLGLCLAELGRQKTAEWKIMRWIGTVGGGKPSAKKVMNYVNKAKNTYVSHVKKDSKGKVRAKYWAGGWMLKVKWKKPAAANAFRKRLNCCRWEKMSDLDKGGALLALAKEKRGNVKEVQIHKPGQGKKAVKKRARNFEFHCRKR